MRVPKRRVIFLIVAVVSLFLQIHFSVVCVVRGLSVTRPTTSVSFWRVVARVCEGMRAWGSVEMSVGSCSFPGHNLIAAVCFKRRHGCCGRNEVRSPLAFERYAFLGCGMEEVLCRLICRTIGSIGDWQLGGSPWTRLVIMLTFELHRELWRYDTDGTRVITSVRKRLLVMEGIRRDGLQLPRKDKLHDGARRDEFGFLWERRVTLVEEDTAGTAAAHELLRRSALASHEYYLGPPWGTGKGQF